MIRSSVRLVVFVRL